MYGIDLNGKVAVVTGSEGEIGSAVMASLSAFGRKGEPDDIAKAVLMLCSDLAGFITAETITVGGLHLP